MLCGSRRMADCNASKSEAPILNDCLAINDCRLAAEIGGSADDSGIAVTPIMSVAAEHTRLTTLNHHLGAVAIVCDFMNPVLALWRLIDRGKLRLDKSEGWGYAHFGLTEVAPEMDAEALPLFPKRDDDGHGHHHQSLTTTWCPLINATKLTPR